MRLLFYLINQASAVGYISAPLAPAQVELPSFAQLITVERILLLALFIFLSVPLLKQRKDPAVEKERVKIIKLSALVGALAIFIRFYRVLAGI